MKLQMLTGISYAAFTMGMILLAGAAVVLVHDWRRRRRAGAEPVCRECGYSLKGHAILEEGKAYLASAERFTCPECGADLRRRTAIVPSGSAETRDSRRNRLAALAIFFGAMICCFIHDAVSKDLFAEMSGLMGMKVPGSDWRDWALVVPAGALVIWALVRLARVRPGRRAS